MKNLPKYFVDKIKKQQPRILEAIDLLQQAKTIMQAPIDDMVLDPNEIQLLHDTLEDANKITEHWLSTLKSSSVIHDRLYQLSQQLRLTTTMVNRFGQEKAFKLHPDMVQSIQFTIRPDFDADSCGKLYPCYVCEEVHITLDPDAAIAMNTAFFEDDEDPSHTEDLEDLTAFVPQLEEELGSILVSELSFRWHHFYDIEPITQQELAMAGQAVKLKDLPPLS